MLADYSAFRIHHSAYIPGGRLAHKIGILGGTFNPVHYGHLAAAEEVRTRLGLSEILFVPSCIPPHKQEEKIPSALHRLEMVHRAIAGNASFKTSDIEIRRGGTSYTIETIEALRRERPGAKLYFITGVDSFLEIRTWKDWERLLGLCTFVVLSRPGYRFSDLSRLDFIRSAKEELEKLDGGELNEAVVRTGSFCIYLELIPLYDISSTDIRKRVREGSSIKYLLPDPVEIYIIENKLYD